MPLQLCSITLSDPEGMGEIVRVFQKDALFLSSGDLIKFINPYSGELVSQKLPKMHAVISNLPFVRFEDVLKLNPNIDIMNKYIYVNHGIQMDKKADLYAYITLKLKDILLEDGRIGLIISNSWLGTNWGNIFRKILLKNFSILRVIISGNGRWFKNAKVVTTIIILEKKLNFSELQTEISFITTLKSIKEWDEKIGNEMIFHTLQAKSAIGIIEAKKYHIETLNKLEKLGLSWNTLFVDNSWIDVLEKFLVPINNLFSINRGERRGWDALFYPQANHNIEPEFIKPVLKSTKNLKGSLIINADDEAFCCLHPIEYLESNKKVGALNWIKKFEKQVNNKGKPLSKILSKGHTYWYEMHNNSLADIVISMNPDKKLCFYKLIRKSFVNQRLIRFTALPFNKNLDLCHALLNSVVSMFLFESIGFGRGLGVLDINSNKVSKQMHMLNPKHLNIEQKNKILEGFKPLIAKPVKDLPNELKEKDRINFDDTVLEVYGIKFIREQIYNSLLNLYNSRQTARNTVTPR